MAKESSLGLLSTGFRLVLHTRSALAPGRGGAVSGVRVGSVESVLAWLLLPLVSREKRANLTCWNGSTGFFTKGQAVISGL